MQYILFQLLTVKLMYGVNIWNENYSKIEIYTSFRSNNNIRTLFDDKHVMTFFNW